MNYVYLASKSPRRRELLEQIGVQYKVLAVDVPEQQGETEPAIHYVERLAQEKAQAGWYALQQQNTELAPVLGADTVAMLDGRVFEKPVDAADGAQMLRTLSGRTHQIVSAVALVCDDKVAVRHVITAVTFRALTDEDIQRYWETQEPVDKAGAYGIQGMGSVFVETIQGSYSAVVGLPLMETAQLLQEFGVAIWQQKA